MKGTPNNTTTTSRVVTRLLSRDQTELRRSEQRLDDGLLEFFELLRHSAKVTEAVAYLPVFRGIKRQ